jgi:hypothetical protein
MGPFRDADEMYKTYATLFDLVGSDSQIGLVLANAGIVVQFRLSNPDGIVTLNMRDKPVRRGMYVDYVLGECDIEADVIFEVSADLSNRFLQGKVNIIRALTAGQIKAKGKTAKALKLMSFITPVFEIYPRLLKEKGWNHLLV